MLTRKSSSWTDQISQFIYGILYYGWDTLESAWEVLLEIAAKLVHFLLAIFNLIFQILIFLRDLCIETMQTFAHVFQGIINVISTISCEDVEDFASACIVVLLWIGAIKVFLNILGKNPGSIGSDNPSEKSDSIYDEEFLDKGFDVDGCPRKLRKRKKPLRRYNRNRVLNTLSPKIYEDESD